MRLFFVVILIMGQAWADGLKKIDFKDQTTESKSPPPAEGQGSITPEQSKELLKQVEAYKAKQAEAAKMLEELDKDE